MPRKLTKSLLDRSEPVAAGTRVLLFDSELPGFGVRITPSGKTFFVQYRAGSGRSAPKRRLSLGQFGTLTIEQARKMAREALADAALGGDPARAKKTDRLVPTLTALGADFLADIEARRKPATAREYARLWTKHVVPALGKRRVGEVTAADVARLHRGMRSTPYGANRVLSLLGSFFAYAQRQGLRAKRENPAHEIEPYRERARERFLTPAEIARLGEALARAEAVGLPVPDSLRSRARGMSAARRQKLTGRRRGPYKRKSTTTVPRPANPFAVAAIRFLLLTGWREREALTLRWADLDMERGTATLSDTKTGRSIRVLGAPARLLISELPRIEGSPFVFPGATVDKPIVEINRVWYAARAAAGLPDVRLHDLRHSFASVTASSGGSLLMIGKLLGHRDSSTTAKYAHLLDDPMKIAADVAAGQIAAWLKGGTVPVQPIALSGR